MSTSLGKPDNQNDETPWCAAFVNWCMMMAGRADRTNCAWARSWLKWGVELEEGVEGCVVVFSRGANAGHVAFYLDEDETHVQVLGGNQGDAVSVAWYPKDRVLGYMLPLGIPGGRVNLNLKDNAWPIIGIITVVGGFVMMWFKPEAKVETLMMAVLTFYFGSSWGSRLKDEAFKLMAQLQNEPKKEETWKPENETDKAVG